MNKIKQIKVKEKMNTLRSCSLITSVGIILTLSSCAQSTEKVEASAPSIQHSSPDVHSLVKYNNKELDKESKGNSFTGKFLGWLFFDSLFGSSPDADDRYQDRRDSGKRKREFLRDNRDEIVEDLESKKD